MSAVNINISPEIFLPCYRHLLNDAGEWDIDFLYGGRDSGKSRHIAMQLVLDCMKAKPGEFRCILARKVGNTILASQWQLIKDVVEQWGLSEFFNFRRNPLEIECKNGNMFLARGLDEPTRLKSISNPTHCWVEEGNQIDAEDFVTIITTLRHNKVRTKVWFSFNPECEGNYTEFWLYQEYFSHTTELSWTWIKDVTIPDNVALRFLMQGDKRVVKREDGSYILRLHIRATHTTYQDNPYCSPQRVAQYEDYKNSKNNQYWYQVYTLGLWGYRKSGGAFWKCFDEVKHVDEFEPIPSTFHVVVDNNVVPYVTVDIWQVDLINKRIIQVDELNCEAPKNTATKAAKELVSYLKKHGYQDGVYLYGDPSANAKTTVDDDGKSFFDKFIGTLNDEKFRVVNRVGKKAPSVARSAEFINDIYENELYGWSIKINRRCRVSIEDYLMVKEDKDGTMMKKREVNKETKQSFERYGHHSDCKRYLLITLLSDEFKNYKKKTDKYFGYAA